MLARIGGDIIPSRRQGVERRISVSLLEALLLSLELAEALSMPIRDAFAVARVLTGGQDVAGIATNPERPWKTSMEALDPKLALGAHLALTLDLQSLRRDVEARVAAAIETVVRPRRGRPPRRS
jgi:hypothetical protein